MNCPVNATDVRINLRSGGWVSSDREHCVALGLFAVIGLMLAIVEGCGTGEQPKSRALSLPKTIDPVLLKSELLGQMDLSLSETIATAGEIAEATKDRGVREKCLRWKMQAQDDYLRILSQEDPRTAFVEEWISAVQVRQYLTDGAGKSAFGSEQPKAVALAEKIEKFVLAIGTKYFSQAAMDLAKDDIEDAARRYATAVPFAIQPYSLAAESRQDLITLMRLPLLPVRGLESAAATPQAIRNFTDTVKSFTAIVQCLPERTRWQSELLLMEMESTGPVPMLAKEVDDFNQRLDGITVQVQTLPAQIRGEIIKTTDAIFWRILALIAAIFILALAYRWIGGRIRK
jgi:hypothetical protein